MKEEYYQFDYFKYWIYTKDEEVIYAERYGHQDGDFSKMCNLNWCRCSD